MGRRNAPTETTDETTMPEIDVEDPGPPRLTESILLDRMAAFLRHGVPADHAFVPSDPRFQLLADYDLLRTGTTEV